MSWARWPALSSEELCAAEALLTGGELRRSTVYDGRAERLSPRRSSLQRTLRSPELFDLGEAALARLSPEVQLVRNHCDYIVSGVGAHFDLHRDFPLVVGDAVSFALLLCLEAPEEGGELRIVEDGRRRALRYERGCGVLLPCALQHAALRVVRGRKRVLRFDALSAEPLRFVGTEDGSVSVPRSVLSGLDALRAQLDFDARFGRACRTSLVSARELRAAVRFFQGRACEPELARALDVLCCPEARLTERERRELVESGAALLDGDGSLGSLGSPGSRSARPLRPAFVASAHCGGLVCAALTDFSGSACALGEAALPGGAEEVLQLVLRRVRRHLAGAELLGCAEAFLTPSAAFPTPSAAFPTQEGEPASLASLAQRLLPRLLPQLERARPSCELTGYYEAQEYCNDGDSYSAHAYQSVELRRGFCLFVP
jgi:hypothetical protein